MVNKPPVGQFIEEFTALGGSVVHCDAPDLSPRLIQFLRERHIHRLQAWDDIPGLNVADLTEAGLGVESSADPEIHCGVTGALAGVAESGTLVLPGGAGRPLSASLLPEMHVAVLRASQIVPDLESALRLPEVTESAAAVLVSGPSRTADIEMTLTIGVHGPKEVIVFLIDDGMGR